MPVTGLLVSVVRGRGCRSLVCWCQWSEGEDAGHWSVTGLLVSVVRGRGCRSLVGHWSAGVGGQRERMPVTGRSLVCWCRWSEGEDAGHWSVTGLLVSVVRGRGCRSLVGHWSAGVGGQRERMPVTGRSLVCWCRWSKGEDAGHQPVPSTSSHTGQWREAESRRE